MRPNDRARRMGPGVRRTTAGLAFMHTPIPLPPLILPARLPLLDPRRGLSERASTGANQTMGPLEGIKVVDMTTVLMGPYATQMLGDYGADVIKIETTDGDVTRQIGPTRHPGMGPVFLNTNRSKRSICLDLKKPAGRDAVLRLIASADVLVYNVRPQAMARLQLGYDVVSKINPRLIYAGVFGFGQDGPYAAKPAYDDLIQGATALPALDGADQRRRSALCPQRAGRPHRRAHGGRRDLRQPGPSRPHRARSARGYSDVRDHGGFRDGRSHGRPDLRAAAGQGRLRAASVARPAALQDVRRLYLRDRLQRQAMGKFLRGDRPRRPAQRSQICDLRRPRRQYRHGLCRTCPHLRNAHHRRMDRTARQGRCARHADARS